MHRRKDSWARIEFLIKFRNKASTAEQTRENGSWRVLYSLINKGRNINGLLTKLFSHKLTQFLLKV